MCVCACVFVCVFAYVDFVCVCVCVCVCICVLGISQDLPDQILGQLVYLTELCSRYACFDYTTQSPHFNQSACYTVDL